MTQEEFEKRYDEKVDDEIFPLINKVYMATEDSINMEGFVELWKTEDGLRSLCYLMADVIIDSEAINQDSMVGKKLMMIAEDFRRFQGNPDALDNLARSFCGEKVYLRNKLENDFTLSKDDYKALLKYVSNG